MLTFWFIHQFFKWFMSSWNTQRVWRTLGCGRLYNGQNDPPRLPKSPCLYNGTLFLLPLRGRVYFPTLNLSWSCGLRWSVEGGGPGLSLTSRSRALLLSPWNPAQLPCERAWASPLKNDTLGSREKPPQLRLPQSSQPPAHLAMDCRWMRRMR